jgi:hypothetical protein
MGKEARVLDVVSREEASDCEAKGQNLIDAAVVTGTGFALLPQTS